MFGKPTPTPAPTGKSLVPVNGAVNKQVTVKPTVHMEKPAMDALKTLLLVFSAGTGKMAPEDYGMLITGYVKVLSHYRTDLVVKICERMLRRNPRNPFAPTPQDIAEECWEAGQEEDRREQAAKRQAEWEKEKEERKKREAYEATPQGQAEMAIRRERLAAIHRLNRRGELDALKDVPCCSPEWHKAIDAEIERHGREKVEEEAKRQARLKEFAAAVHANKEKFLREHPDEAHLWDMFAPSP